MLEHFGLDGASGAIRKGAKGALDLLAKSPKEFYSNYSILNLFWSPSISKDRRESGKSWAVYFLQIQYFLSFAISFKRLLKQANGVKIAFFQKRYKNRPAAGAPLPDRHLWYVYIVVPVCSVCRLNEIIFEQKIFNFCFKPSSPLAKSWLRA